MQISSILISVIQGQKDMHWKIYITHTQIWLFKDGRKANREGICSDCPLLPWLLNWHPNVLNMSTLYQCVFLLRRSLFCLKTGTKTTFVIYINIHKTSIFLFFASGTKTLYQPLLKQIWDSTKKVYPRTEDKSCHHFK